MLKLKELVDADNIPVSLKTGMFSRVRKSGAEFRIVGSEYFPERNGTYGTVSDWLTSERGRIIGQ